MTSKTSKDRPQATARAAEIVREYGPFAGADRVHGVTHDGQHVWAATGASLVAFDPASGEPARTLDRACDAGTAFDGTYLYQIAEARIDKIDPVTGDVVASIPAPGNGTDSGLTWAEGSLWVGQYRDRKIHQIDPATGAIRRTIESNRFVTGVTWVDGAVARNLGRGRQRHPPRRPGERRRARAARNAARQRCQRPGMGRCGPFLLRRRSEWKSPRRTASEAKEHTMNTAIAEAGTVDHPVVSRERWVAKRMTLLAREKELTRLADQIARERRALPWVRIEKNYVFDAPEGRRSLADLFDGRCQLLVQHFMFGPGWEQGCPSCSFMADHIDGMNVHLAHRDVTLLVVSRAPLSEIQRFRQRMGWQFRWVSSHGNDFNHDFGVSFTPEERATGEVLYNYGVRPFPSEEAPGVSVFYKDDAGEIFHTYSTYGRGVEVMMGTYKMLDLTPKGRDEAEVDNKMEWVRHHDRYEPAVTRTAAAASSCCHAQGTNN